MKPKDMLES